MKRQTKSENSDADIQQYRSRMAGAGPFYARADAPHGGPWSPNDGERCERLAVIKARDMLGRDAFNADHSRLFVEETLRFSVYPQRPQRSRNT